MSWIDPLAVANPPYRPRRTAYNLRESQRPPEADEEDLLPERNWVLEHTGLDAFEPILRKIYFELFQAGKDRIRQRGRRLDDIRTDMALLDLFLRLCHRGYRRGQRLLADQAIHLMRHISAVRGELKDARRSRRRDDAAELLTRLSVLHNRLAVLRSMADRLALALVQDQTWIMHRFMHRRDAPALSEKAIRSALEAAEKINQRTRRFALVTDLTSCVHVGDLLCIDLEEGGISVIELKEGKVNEAILGTLENGPSPEAVKALAERHGAHAVEQLERVRRQIERLRQTTSTIAAEKGIDVATGLPVVIGREPVQVGEWVEAFWTVIDRARAEDLALVSVEEALHVGAFLPNRVANGAHVIAHAIFHSLEAGERCVLSAGGAEAEAEMHAVGQRIISLVDLRESLLWGDTVTPWVLPIRDDINTVMDIVFGRLVVLLHLDPHKLVDLAVRLRLPLRLATAREQAGWSKLRELGAMAVLNGRMLLATVADRTVGLGGGTVRRTLFSFHRPSTLVRVLFHEIGDLPDRLDRLDRRER